MLKQLFDRIQETAIQSQQVEIHGHQYIVSHDGVTRVPVPAPDRHKEPEIAPLAVHSLSGLVGFYKEANDRSELGHGAMLHIVDPRKVQLVSDVFGALRQREVYVEAKAATGDQFPFGKWMSPDLFVIHLLALFIDAGDIGDIMTVVGNLAEESVITNKDDGVTQTVTVKRGIRKTEDVVIRNPVELSPYRTFADVEQPSAKYVLRTRGGGGEQLPEVALFEVDDGRWRNECIERIGAYLEQALPGVPVIG